MLHIIMEFRKGILFVRLYGELTKHTVSKFQGEVIDMIQKNGIRSIVLNIENLESLDLKGVNSLLYCYECCKKNKGETLLCGIKNETIRQRLDRGRVLHYIFQIKDELDALEKVKL